VDASLTRPGRGRLFLPSGPRVSGSGPSGLAGSVPAAQASISVTAAPLAWLEVSGGTLPASRWRPAACIGDLAWTAIPVTIRTAGLVGVTACGDPAVPLTMLDWHAARALAEALGGRLPTSAEWEWMAGHGKRRYPWGDDDPGVAHANLREAGLGRPVPAGSHPAGTTPEGITDVAGNVWEWTATTVPGGGAVVRGASYNSISLYTQCGFSSEIPMTTVSPGIGLRLVRTP
jgi:hypothetical protein